MGGCVRVKITPGSFVGVSGKRERSEGNIECDALTFVRCVATVTQRKLVPVFDLVP